MKLIATIPILTAAVLLLAACSSNEGATQVALERAQATAEAAVISRNSAIAERDDAVARAEQAEKSADRLAAIKDRGDVVCATGNDTPGSTSSTRQGGA